MNCVECGQSEEREPLIEPCNCPKGVSPVHYSCVTSVIARHFDPPCGQCGQRYIDLRITRYPTFCDYLTREAGIVFLVLFHAINLLFMGQKSILSHKSVAEKRLQLKDIHHMQDMRHFLKAYRSPLCMAGLAGLANSIVICLALCTYKIWYRRQPKYLVMNHVIDGKPAEEYVIVSYVAENRREMFGYGNDGGMEESEGPPRQDNSGQRRLEAPENSGQRRLEAQRNTGYRTPVRRIQNSPNSGNGTQSRTPSVTRIRNARQKSV